MSTFRINLIDTSGIGFHCFDANADEPPKLLEYHRRFFVRETKLNANNSPTRGETYDYRETPCVEVVLTLKSATVSS